MRHFSIGDFLSTEVGYNPSYAWHSITTAQSIVLQGTWWQVGNGHSIEICGDNWLHKISTFRLTSQPIAVPSDDKDSVEARPWLEKTVRPSFDHPPWRCSHMCEAHWWPLLIIGVVRAELQVLSLSLSQGRKVFVYLWRCGMNLHQILGVKSSPIIGFF